MGAFQRYLLRRISFFISLTLLLLTLIPNAYARSATWPFDVAGKYLFDPVDIEIADGSASLVPISHSDNDSSPEEFGGGVVFGVSWSEDEKGLTLQTQTNLWELPDYAASNEWIDMKDNVLLMHLNKSGAKNGMEIQDDSGNGNNGTLITKGSQGEKSAEGKLAGSLHFDGVSFDIKDMVEGQPTDKIIGDNCQKLTMALWVRSTDEKRSYIASLKAKNGPSTLLSLTMNAKAGGGGVGRLGFLTLTHSQNHQYLDHFGNYNDGRWHHVAAVIDDMERILYIDGEKISSDELGIKPKTGNTGTFTVGGFASTHKDLQFTGDVDEVGIWRRALSGEEIGRIYEAQRPKVSGYFDSRVMDSGDDGGWNSIAWDPKRPYGKELPDDKGEETAYSQGDVSMDENIVLFHMNGDVEVLDEKSEISNSSGVAVDGVTFGNVSIKDGGVFKEAVYFGEGGFVEIDKLPVRPDDGAKTTVEFWFNWDGRDRTAFGWNQAYGLDFRDGCVGFKVGDSILGVESNGYASGWHHIVAVFNNGEVSDGNIKLYLDGKKQSIDNCRGDVPNIKFTATSKPRIGGLASGSTANFEGGMVDEFAIYNRELTEAEIQNRYIRGAIDVKYQVRTCDLADCEGESFIGPDGTNGSYYSELMNQDDSLPEIPFINLQTDKRYLQYRAFLSSDIKSILPLVKSVSIGPGYYATTNPTIINKTPAPKYSSLQSFVETVEVDNGGSVRYQISNDGDIWYYFNNAVWVEASGFDETNSAQEIDEHLPLFVEDVGIGTFYFKAFLHSGGIGDVKLDSIAIEYEFAGAAILVFESGGSTLVSQDGKKDKYSIVLNKEPQHNVTVMLNVDDEVVVEPQYLVFTPENWAAPQEVTISASENGNDDGPDSVVLSHTSISEDRKYDDLEISDVTIKVERLQISESVPLEEEKEVLETPQEDNQDDESAEGAGSDAAAKAGVAQSCTLIVR